MLRLGIGEYGELAFRIFAYGEVIADLRWDWKQLTGLPSVPTVLVLPLLPEKAGE